MKVIFALLLVSFSAHAQSTLQGVQNINYSLEPQTEMLIAKPAEVEKLSEDSEIISPSDYRELVRMEAQVFDRPQRGPGRAVWIMYRNRVSKKWEIAARFDTISRYDVTDEMIGGGVLMHVKKSVLRVEVAKSRKGGLFPDTTVELEYVTPLTQKLVGYVSTRRTSYQEDGATNLLTSLAAEYYIAGNNMIFARVSLSRTDFRSGANDTLPVAVVHFTHYINDFDKVTAFVGNANESILRQYDQIVNTARGITYGASYRKRVGQSPWIAEVGIEQSHMRYPNRKVTDRAIRISITRLIK